MNEKQRIAKDAFLAGVRWAVRIMVTSGHLTDDEAGIIVAKAINNLQNSAVLP